MTVGEGVHTVTVSVGVTVTVKVGVGVTVIVEVTVIVSVTVIVGEGVHTVTVMVGVGVRVKVGVGVGVTVKVTVIVGVGEEPQSVISTTTVLLSSVPFSLLVIWAVLGISQAGRAGIPHTITVKTMSPVAPQAKFPRFQARGSGLATRACPLIIWSKQSSGSRSSEMTTPVNEEQLVQLKFVNQALAL